MTGRLEWVTQVRDRRRRCEWCGRLLASPRARVRGRRACSADHARALEDWWSPGPG